MRICHITTVHSVKDARIFYRMCSALAAKNLSVTIVGATPFVEDSGVLSSPWNERITQARRIHRIGLALRAALAEGADVYHFHDPELIPIGFALKVLKPSKAVVYDVHEDYPSMMREKYWIPPKLRPFVAASMRLINRAAGAVFDGIVTADLGVKSEFDGAAGRKTIVYYNFPIIDFFNGSNGNGAGPKADLVYIGGMSERTGIFVLLDALSLLAERNVRPTVKLGGYTDGEAGLLKIREGIEKRGLGSQIELRGKMPYAEVPSWIRSGRIGLVGLQPIPKFLKNIPTKMFEYWACGLPVIASDLPPIRQFCIEGKNGLLFSPSDPGDLARAIQYLLEHPKEIEAMGNFGREQIFTTWNNDRQIDGLIQFYERISARTKGKGARL